MGSFSLCDALCTRLGVGGGGGGLGVGHASVDDGFISEGSSDVYDMSEVVEQREEGKEEEEDMESQDEKDDELMRKMKKEQSSSDEDPIRRVLKVCHPIEIDTEFVYVLTYL